MAEGVECASDDEAAPRRVVLVVEDEVLLRSNISDYLREEGFRVVEAANAVEATRVLGSGEHVDIVFTDVQMPGVMDGVMLARWIAINLPSIQVVVTSGRNAEGLSGAAFIPKPYRFEDIVQRFREMAANSKSS
jgi:CheY-like chemotaxis protein